jgi:hypothetical protein
MAAAAEFATLFADGKVLRCVCISLSFYLSLVRSPSNVIAQERQDLNSLSEHHYPFPFFVDNWYTDHQLGRAATNLGNGVCFARRMPSLMAFNLPDSITLPPKSSTFFVSGWHSS